MSTDEELVVRFAGHALDRDSAPHFRGRLERRLLINRCEACGFWRHPPKPVCPRCWSGEVRPTEIAGTGVIHLLIFLHQGPPAEGVDYSNPYPVATVELDEQPGLRFTSTIVGAPNEAIAIGKRVKLDWIERGGAPMPVFRLAEEGRA
ncbi:MAG: OB-fold domain-containing protein [Caulobacteraceae bacterium]|nr:OB-fold domain-containing protein [Caulobacteraceae bacterium]